MYIPMHGIYSFHAIAVFEPAHATCKCTKSPSNACLCTLNVISIYNTVFSADGTLSSATAVSLFLALFFNTFSMKASPALYELLTSGPLAQYRKPISKARCLHISKVAGVTYASTFMCRFVGRIY